MGSSPSSEGVLTGSGGCSEGLGLGLSALSRATSIFGICTREIKPKKLDTEPVRSQLRGDFLLGRDQAE
ncbi:hypothetical protein F2Q70_00017641 [Brassica cretica]|uniref:Uncharacterized protein n=1 Tax=Brassica cretica TaxID=69181 RepID=A0A8S9HW85_BRACR|nr:hypothetical protein F2Q70_00017641 [Brassica cretica]